MVFGIFWDWRLGLAAGFLAVKVGSVRLVLDIGCGVCIGPGAGFRTTVEIIGVDFELVMVESRGGIVTVAPAVEPSVFLV